MATSGYFAGFPFLSIIVRCFRLTCFGADVYVFVRVCVYM